VKCISCDTFLQDAIPETSEGDPRQQPNYGLVCYSHGNFGSALFDPMDGASSLEFYLCDECAKKKAEIIYFVEARATKAENVFMTFDEFLKRKAAQ